MTALTTPARSPLHPAINTLLAGIRTGDPKIHNGLGLWPVFADGRPEPAYLTLIEALVEALVLDGFVHLALFGGGGLGQSHPPTEPRLRRRHRGWI